MIRFAPYCLLLVLAACDKGSPFARQFFDPVAFRIITPSDDGVANDLRPMVRWSGYPGALSYRALLYMDPSRQQILEIMHAGSALEARAHTTLTDGSVYYMQVQAWGALGVIAETGISRFRVRVVPDGFPRFVLRSEDRLRHHRGYRLVPLLDIASPSGSLDRVGRMGAVNDAGEYLWWYTHPQPGRLSEVELTSDDTLYYLARTISPTGPGSMGAYEVTWDGDLLWQSRPGALVHHDIQKGPGGMTMYMTYLFEDYAGETYEGDGIELIDKATNTVLWSWNIFDHYSPADYHPPEADFLGISRLGKDWSHANAIFWDEPRNLIWMSIRHFDHVIGIDFPSGDIKIVIGTGGLGGEGLMARQHAPEIQADGSMLLWNNGNGTTQPFSSVLQIRFDELAGTAVPIFQWRASPDIFDFALGDVDRLPNGNILATAGISGRLIEIDPTGEVVWELFQSNPAFWIYRTEVVEPEQFPARFKPFP